MNGDVVFKVKTTKTGTRSNGQVLCALDTSVNERQFQLAITRLARAYGWMVSHTQASTPRPGRTTTSAASGSPDLLMVDAERGLFIHAELKSESGGTRAEQVAWLDALARAASGTDGAVTVWLARPRHWPQIAALLTGTPVDERLSLMTPRQRHRDAKYTPETAEAA